MPLLSSILPKILEQITGQPTGPLQSRRLGGGSINETIQIITSDRRTWFCKINETTGLKDLFRLESEGLKLLSRQNIFRIPEVITCNEIDPYQVLVLEWIEPGPRTRPDSAGPSFWKTFGEQLAQLHHVTAPQFGLETPNYMGSLLQSNHHEPDWISFFIRQRLQPQIRLAASQSLLPSRALDQFERLYKTLPEIFHVQEPPSLLHGDLWSGNYLSDAQSKPVLIDPAPYYGHRSIDLAMTTLFGGFDDSFYEAYDYHYPFPPDHRRQWDICNLYPLLIHLNLFGESYLASILRTIQPF